MSPSQTAAQAEAAIADEQQYLFHGDAQLLHDGAWRSAACTGADPELFFPLSVRDHARAARAKAYCASCPVREACLDIALADPTLTGIWGGTDEAQRTHLRNRRRLTLVP